MSDCFEIHFFNIHGFDLNHLTMKGKVNSKVAILEKWNHCEGNRIMVQSWHLGTSFSRHSDNCKDLKQMPLERIEIYLKNGK